MALPLPLYEQKEIGPLESRDGKAFTAVIGLGEELVAQLKAYSLNQEDSELQNNSSDFTRFGEGSYESWYAKERTPFALVDPENGKLAAIAWLGPKPLGLDSKKHLSPEEQEQYEKKLESGNWHTISFRSYPEYRGTGLMKGFAKLVIQEYKKHYPHAKIWAITDRSNPASIRLSEALGLSIVSETDKGRVTMAEQ
ncbi:GNAT family N-acetyltransferase [Patescibacteria group bacterium]|nr:GNAT family N-acetyltransferase [Patescibacteria group bacterium]